MWLFSEQQEQFKPDMATVHAQWVATRTYSYIPPRPPEPMNRRRLLGNNAIEAWQTIQILGAMCVARSALTQLKTPV